PPRRPPSRRDRGLTLLAVGTVRVVDRDVTACARVAPCLKVAGETPPQGLLPGGEVVGALDPARWLFQVESGGEVAEQRLRPLGVEVLDDAALAEGGERGLAGAIH